MRIPFPPSDGATIAMYNLFRSLRQKGADVRVLAFNTNKNFVQFDASHNPFMEESKMEAVPLDLSIKIHKAFLNLFSSQSYNISRFYSETFDRKLTDILKQQTFDIIQLEGLFMSPYLHTIRKYSGAKVVLRSHNVEHIIWERMAAASTNVLKKMYLNLLAQRLKRYELNMMNSFDALVTITPVDAELYKGFGCSIPMHIAPIGVDTETYWQAVSDPIPFSVFHLGSMDWMPNLEAVDWFLQKVYPRLKYLLPDLKIYLAGKDMPRRIHSLSSENLVVENRISDSKKYMLNKPVMMVPLLSGGGMRVKIIEGMAAGKAIVSTSVGAEGIEYTHGKNILIADSPGEFANAITRLYRDPLLIKELSSGAVELARQQYDNRVIGENLFAFYKKIIGRKE